MLSVDLCVATSLHDGIHGASGVAEGARLFARAQELRLVGQGWEDRPAVHRVDKLDEDAIPRAARLVAQAGEGLTYVCAPEMEHGRAALATAPCLGQEARHKATCAVEFLREAYLGRRVVHVLGDVVPHPDEIEVFKEWPVEHVH